jgi:hypothetical protein
MSALSSAVDDNQQPDGVRALKIGDRVWVEIGNISGPAVVVGHSRTAGCLAVVRDGHKARQAIHQSFMRPLQTANEHKAQPVEIAEKSANT